MLKDVNTDPRLTLAMIRSLQSVIKEALEDVWRNATQIEDENMRRALISLWKANSLLFSLNQVALGWYMSDLETYQNALKALEEFDSGETIPLADILTEEED